MPLTPWNLSSVGKQLKEGLAVALFLLPSIIFAEVPISGEGRFISQEGDSLGFINNQLLYNAFRDVITKEMKAIGLDSRLFWNNYDEKFAEHFSPTEASLRKNFVNKQGKMSREQRAKYRGQLRRKRLSIRSSYGGLNKIIPSYSVRRREQSRNSSPSRRLIIEARVDRKTLHQIYLSFTSGQQKKSFQRLFLSSRVSIKNIDSLGRDPEDQRNFTRIIEENWQNWFQKNMSDIFHSVSIMDDFYRGEIDDFLRMPREEKEALLTDGPRDSTRSLLSESLLIRINVELEKTDEDNLLGNGDFMINMNYIGIDLRTNTPIFYRDKDPEKRTLVFTDTDDLNTQLSRIIHRWPIDQFEKIRTENSLATAPNNVFEIKISNATNVLDLFELSSHITNEGIIYGVNPSISRYNGDTGHIVLSFKGTREDILSFLQGLDGGTFATGKTVVSRGDRELNIVKESKGGG